MDFEIVIIDDNIKNTDPLPRTLSKSFPSAIIKNFADAEEGSNYILSNLTKKIIVFLDCRFDSGIQGIEALKRIREKTSLVYIIMMSANQLLQLEEESVKFMVNHRGVFFIRNTEIEKATELVTKINYLMDTKLDCVLEQWILNHPEELLNKPYITTSDKGVMSLNDVLVEIRNQSDFGKTLERNLMVLTIDLFTRGKRMIAND